MPVRLCVKGHTHLDPLTATLVHEDPHKQSNLTTHTTPSQPSGTFALFFLIKNYAPPFGRQAQKRVTLSNPHTLSMHAAFEWHNSSTHRHHSSPQL